MAPRHYLLCGAGGLASSTAAGFLASLLGGIPFGLWITFLSGPAAGWFVARVIDASTGFKRGAPMAAVGAAAMVSPIRLLTSPVGIFYTLLAGAAALAYLRQ